MKDRKAYWRQYQQARYQSKKSRDLSTQTRLRGTSDLLPSEPPDQMFRRLVRERNLQGQGNWRIRAKLKQEVYAFVGVPLSATVRYPERLLTKVKTSAKQSGRSCTVTIADFAKLPINCPILGIPLDYPSLFGRLVAGTPSVDRIDSARGYEPDNIQIISWRANRLKNDATLEELRALGKWASKQ